MPGALFIEGDQVNLRTVEEEDIEFLRNNINKTDVRTNITVRKPVNLKQEKDFFEEVISTDENIHLAICSEEEIVGIISLEEDDKEIRVAEIGIWIAPEHHRNGYGTEASELITDYGFNELNLHRIMVRAYEGNEGSNKIWKRLGFQQEGKFRSHAYINGEFHDVMLYGVIEDEWN